MRIAVVDTETTGVYFTKDRILEVAAVQLDEGGIVVRSFESLVNPDRDIGNSHIHGIRASDVVEAPFFSEVAGGLADFLCECDILLAFNARFDETMLCREFERVGYDMPTGGFHCVQAILSALNPNAPRDLRGMCQSYEIPFSREHSARADVDATVGLVRARFQTFKSLVRLPQVWPRFEGLRSRSLLPRKKRSLTSEMEVGKLGRLIERLPSHPTEVALDEYFGLLDKVFADSVLTEKEKSELFELAAALGMGQAQLLDAHARYVDELVQVAQADNYISAMECEHLSRVASALGLDWKSMGAPLQALALYPRDLKGKRVCFTGTFRGVRDGVPVGQSEMIHAAEVAGLSVCKSVVRGLDFLVVGDVHTRSTKAKTARERQIPIVAEQVFWNWLGIQVRCPE